MIDTLVTGGSGYIGTELINKIGKQKVRVLSRKPLKGIDTFVCDLKEEKIPDLAFKGIKTIYHLASYTHDILPSNQQLQNYKSLNVDATVHLAKLALKYKVRNFIYLSSVKAGGVSKNREYLSETDQFQPEDIYGKTKRDAEIVLQNIFANTNLHYVILRPTLVYGKKLKGNLELMYKYSKIGIFPPLPETFNRKTLIHVDDLIDVMILVRKNKLFRGEIFIVTDGFYYSSKAIYDAILSSLNKPLPKWRIPFIIFKLISLLHPRIQLYVKKIFEDAPYSSNKLFRYGFKAKNKLKKIL